MRHVIVIESSDDHPPSSEEDRAQTRDHIIAVVDALMYQLEGECFLRSAFYVKSAVQAVKEMYDAA